MKKRIEWIDIAKYICIMFVISSHLELCPEPIRFFFSPFYLVGFLFCSGYCYNSVSTFSLLLNKKIKQLFIPWLFFSNANIVLSQIKSFKYHNEFKVEFLRNMLQVRGFDDRLWFIAALFVAYIPFYFLIKTYEENKIKEKNLVIIISVLYVLRRLYNHYMPGYLFYWGTNNLPWHIDYIPNALYFMTLGYLFKTKYESNKLDIFLKNKIIVITLIYLAVVYLQIVFYESVLANYIVTYIGHISGIIFIIALSKLIKSNKYINYVGGNTLAYFSMHNKVSTFVEVILERLLNESYSVIAERIFLSTLYCIVTTFVISLFLIIPTTLINKYCPFLLGKKKSKC